MPSNWDRFDEADEMPYFTLEERARIEQVYNAMVDQYDPVEARRKKNREFVFGRRSGSYDDGKKIQEAEDAAGWPRSSPY